MRFILACQDEKSISTYQNKDRLWSRNRLIILYNILARGLRAQMPQSKNRSSGSLYKKLLKWRCLGSLIFLHGDSMTLFMPSSDSSRTWPPFSSGKAAMASGLKLAKVRLSTLSTVLLSPSQRKIPKPGSGTYS